jgi:hypothetical protein
VLQQAGRVGRDPACPGLAVFFVSEASLGRLTYIPTANASEAHKAHVKTYADGVCRIMTSKRCLHQALMAEFDETVAPCGDMCCIRKYVPRLAPLTVPSEPPSHPAHIEIQAAWEALPAAVRAADGVLHPLAPAPQPLPPPPPTVPAPPTASSPSTPVKATVAARRALTAAFAAHARAALFLSLDDGRAINFGLIL